MFGGTSRLFAAITCVISLTGCGLTAEGETSSQPSRTQTANSGVAQAEPAPVPLNFKVVEQAIWPRSETYFDFVLVLSNPNTDFAWDSASVDIDGVAADGSILDSTWATVSLLPDRSRAIYGSLFTDGRAPVALELRGMSTPTFVGDSTYCNIEASRVKVEPAYGDTWVRGYVTSDCESALEDVAIQVLIRDSKGKLIFGGEGTVGIVKPQTESFAEILLWDVEVPPSSSIELVSELGF